MRSVAHRPRRRDRPEPLENGKALRIVDDAGADEQDHRWQADQFQDAAPGQPSGRHSAGEHDVIVSQSNRPECLLSTSGLARGQSKSDHCDRSQTRSLRL